MSRTEQALLLLLRSGLWETPLKEPEPFPLSEDEWKEVEELATKQTVQGLVFRGMQLLPADLLPSQQQLWKWTMTITRLESDYQRILSTIAATHALLKEADAEVWLQKGIAVARYYDRPPWRVNGDVDWYVHTPQDFTSIGTLLRQRGYATECRADASLCFEHEDVIVELHHHLVDFFSTRGRAAANALVHEEKTQELSLAEGTVVITPGPATTLLMLIVHLLKHVSSVGIGLRQFCDLARALHALHDQYDADALRTACHQGGIDRWCRLLGSFLSEVLALPQEENPFSHFSVRRSATLDTSRISKFSISHFSIPHFSISQFSIFNIFSPSRLLRDVLSSGNFRHKDSDHPSVSHTARQMIRRLPFSLCYAPSETACYVGTLLKNKIK